MKTIRPGLLLILLLATPLGAAEEERDPAVLAFRNPKATGLLVAGVEPFSAAEDAEVAPGDILVRYDGKPITDFDGLRAALGAAAASGKETVTVAVVGPDGTEREMEIATGRMGITLKPVVKGVGPDPLPDATDVRFDFSDLAEHPRDDWFAFHLGGKHVGYEHQVLSLREGRIHLRREVAFDGGEDFGAIHMDVTVVMTAGARPDLVSFRFESVPDGRVGEADVEVFEDGSREFHYRWENRDDESGAHGFEAPRDLFPSYMVEVLASRMPREAGACVPFRPVSEGSGAADFPSALFCAAEEEVSVGAEPVATFRYEWRVLGGAVGSTHWVDTNGRVVKSDFGGTAVNLRASEEAALAGVPESLAPRSRTK